METEIWKDIEGYIGLYQVSNFGRVRSLGNGKSKNSKMMVLSQRLGKEGYYYINLYNKGIRKTFKIHRLVANAFLPNPLNLPCVNHKDEDKTNNFCGTPENDFDDSNLEWCTNQYNSNYGTAIKRMVEKTSKPVLQFTKNGELIKEWSSTQEIKRQLGYSNGNISVICNNKPKHKTAYGFIWKYKERVD